jgi:long-subunit fatty acid transport protein
MAKNKQQFINNGLSEYLAGIEYRINDRFLVSCGTQFTRTGVTDDYQTDLSFSLNSYSVGFGGAINLTHRIRLNLAYFFTNYENWNKTVADYGNFNSISQAIPVTTGTDTYGRTNKAFGIGLDFRF